MNRLSPWSNDPTSDPSSEVIYLRDEETGDFWTPTPLPLGPQAMITVRHGQGYTRYTHVSHHLNQDLVVFVPTDDPIKLECLTVRNDGDRPRRLSATYYAEWVLGTVRENAPLHVVCQRDPESAAILAQNAWAGNFAEKIAFVASGSPTQSGSADRTEFLGEHGSISTPAALRRVGLSGRAGPALDPCAALTMELTLAPGQTREVVFALGQADSLKEVHRLISEYTPSNRAHAALTQVQQQWDRHLNALQVMTWYTGSASWLYRVAIETILGVHLRGETLRVEPCIPSSWPGFELSYRHRSATYRIRVDNAAGTGRGVRSVELDGQRLPTDTVPLSDDGQAHNVRVQLG